MAGYQGLSKSKELLRLIPDLQCHDCKSVPGPNENQKNRYSCVNGSHILCEEHKAKCPCGSKVGTTPSPFIAKVLQDLPWMCENYKTGCQEIKMNVEDLEHHQRKCIYRKVFCPFPGQHCQSHKILFKDVVEHLKASHKGFFEMASKENRYRWYAVGDKPLENCWTWVPGKITTSCGATFFTCAKIVNDTFHHWVIFLGSSDEAENYSSSISIETKIGKQFNKFNFTGAVHTIDEGAGDIIASGSLLSIGLNAAKRLLNGKKRLEFEITIRNLKEEAKDDDVESVISDEEFVISDEEAGISDEESGISDEESGISDEKSGISDGE